MTRNGPIAFDAWRAALEVTARLTGAAARRRGQPRAQAIAVTGSLARGDFAPGSDVDLWVLGPKNARDVVTGAGVPVSLLWQTVEHANSLEGLLLFEVEDAVVLHDPEGLLTALKDLAALRRQELHTWVRGSSAVLLTTLVDAVPAMPPAHAVATLREVARRGAALGLFLERGWRVPRMRHFQRGLSGPAWKKLHQLLALSLDEKARGALPALLEEARRGPAPLKQMRLPEPALVERYLGAGRVGDALVTIRQGLPPRLDGRKARLTRAQRALFDVVHGFSAPPSPALIAPTARAVRHLLEELRVLSLTGELEKALAHLG